MKCKNCQSEVLGNFCGKCGAQVISQKKRFSFKDFLRIVPLIFVLGFFGFGILKLTTDVVRKNNFEIDLPKTPATYYSYDILDDFAAMYELTDIEYKVSGDDLIITFKGEKIYDVDGNDELREVQIVWQLLDSSDNVVAGDEVDSPDIEVGENFVVESYDYTFEVDLKENYRLIIKNACEEDPGTSNEYEDLFLGKWSNDEALLSFQYKNGKYCGGAMSNEINTVVFEEYKATKNYLTLYLEDGSEETFSYFFKNGCLYLDDSKFEPFD